MLFSWHCMGSACNKTVVKNHFLQFHGLNTTSKNGEMY